MKVLIVGAGIAGLTLANFLQRAGIRAEVFEAAAEIRPLGLGVNMLPHAGRLMRELGVFEEMRRRAVETRESTYFNRFGQHVYSEPAGLAAGYDIPQLSIHRADIQEPLLDAFLAAAGGGRLHLGHRCTGFEQDADGVTAHFADARSGAALPPVRGDVLVAADGIHSVIRRRLHPTEGEPVYSGVNMWRGATVLPPFLEGANMCRVGWLATGKLVIYPIRNDVDGRGNQLVNWVAELEMAEFRRDKRDWNQEGELEEFIQPFKDMRFAWLDIPGMLRRTERILEYPMVDQDPLPFWGEGRVTLMGDAAHPMYPRGSNGAGQAIIDGAALARHLAAGGPVAAALRAYEDERRPATAAVVLANRRNPPDVILREVYERTGDRPFRRIEDVISREEMAALTDRYKQVAGYALDRTAGDTQASGPD